MSEEELVTSSINNEDGNLRHRKGLDEKLDNPHLTSNGSDVKEIEATKVQYMPRCSAPVHKSLKESPLSSDAIFHQVSYILVLFILNNICSIVTFLLRG
jgi:hypothetical protein